MSEYPDGVNPYADGFEDGFKKGRADAIDNCTEILARLVTMELLDLNTYELVKAELEQTNEEG